MTTIPPPKFEDLMKRYHGEIARNADAAWLTCPVKEKEEIGMPNNPENTCCNSCRFKQKIDEELFECSLVFIMRWIIGDDLYCSPCERTMPECGACKGPAEIGQCPHGEPLGREILCWSPYVCDYKIHRGPEANDMTPELCGREDAALAACEQYQQEIRQEDGS
jgi:hypothetical protein